MNAAGLCVVCNKPARDLNTCWRCGANVCGAHFNEKTGLCFNCSRGNVLGKIAKTAI